MNGKRHLRSLYLEEEFFRYLELLILGTTTDTFNIPTKVFNDKRIDQIIAYMKTHLATEVSLNTLGSLVQCTPFHVIRLFKKTLGISPHAYFIQLRLEQARDLIDAEYNLTDAALLAGFSDQSHLTRRFKKRYGITPGAYNEQKNC